MTDPGTRFETGVAKGWGFWPEPPTLWSYSSLTEVETCPRRWMLLRASYPEIWAKRGFPQVPHLSALLGDVVHRVLEVIVHALTAAGCSSTHSVDAVDVIRSLGGLSSIIRDAIDRKVNALADNPRLSEERREGLRRSLTDQSGIASNRVQVFLSRVTLPAWVGEAQAAVTADLGAPQGLAGPRRRSSVEVGAHPEVDVVAEELRLWGRIDLVTFDDESVTITDYKSGQEDASHDDQVRLYALLWDLDRQSNPECRSATRLVVSYPARDRTVTAPDPGELRALEATTKARIDQANAEVVAADPRAVPSPDVCPFCQVRQFCQDYWERIAPDPATVSPRDWFDLEGTVLRQNGIKSWVVESTRRTDAQVLVRTPSPSETLPIGRTVRLLDVRRVSDPDEPDKVIAALGSTSETFLLDESS